MSNLLQINHVISLSHLNLQDEELRNFEFENQQKGVLTDLYLDHNLLSFSIFDHVVFDWVKTLDLSYNRLGVVGATAIGGFIAATYTCESINLWGNELCDLGFQEIARALSANTCVVHVDVGSNGITDVSSDALVLVLANNKTLASLEIGSNLLTDATVQAIKEPLLATKTLSEFFFSDNPITNCGADILMRCLEVNPQLRIFRLRDDESRTDLPYLHFEIDIAWWNCVKVEREQAYTNCPWK
ncbi:hypothetical protein HDU91_003255 [Kappamyces sp. JEL0680]|nr:hypothetical protein HDU91_003255 [Kappamyces sp. JEL0680]